MNGRKKNEMMADIYKNVINEEDNENSKSFLSGNQNKIYYKNYHDIIIDKWKKKNKRCIN